MKHLSRILQPIACAALLADAARANDSVNSELSHFAGNAAIASITTVVIHKVRPQTRHPAVIGFAVSASEAVLGEAVEKATGSGPFSVLDVAAGTLGAALGSYATGKWYIEPRVETRKEETTYGIMARRKF